MLPPLIFFRAMRLDVLERFVSPACPLHPAKAWLGFPGWCIAVEGETALDALANAYEQAARVVDRLELMNSALRLAFDHAIEGRLPIEFAAEEYRE